ncbi:MAG: ROK family protein, partial [Spirochaetota bacterium]
LWYGQAKNCDNFILVDLGQGIGLGIVINGTIYEGANLKAGEIGHLIIDPGGRKCSCGNYGCLESVASGSAITSIIQEELKKGTRSRVQDLVNGHIDELTALEVVEAANMNDPLSIEVLNRAGKQTGKAISYTIDLFNPEMIVIGGQLSKAGRHLMDPLITTLKECTLPSLLQDVAITHSGLGPLSAALGAATIAINDKIFSL